MVRTTTQIGMKIVKQPRTIPYPMWYNTIPYFVPMDLNIYLMYYLGIEGLDPLISRRRKENVVGVAQP